MRILLGVTGGIAAYKSCEFTSLAVKAGHDVRVIMTANATRFVAPLTFEALSGNPVLLDTYDTAPGLSGDGYNGCYGVYPFGPGGIVYVSDDENGLFLFQVEDFSGAPTAVGDTPAANTERLLESYPNPFNPSTTIKFSITSAAQTFLYVYDILGREVTTLVNQQLQPGTYEVNWDASSSPNGVYFYKLTAGSFIETRKMVLLK